MSETEIYRSYVVFFAHFSIYNAPETLDLAQWQIAEAGDPIGPVYTG